MAIIYCHIKESPFKVPVNFPLSFSLQTCGTPALWCLADTSSMEYYYIGSLDLCFCFLLKLFNVYASLTNCSVILQGIRSMNSNGTAIRRSSLLCRSMLKFISSLLHFLTFEVSPEFPPWLFCLL